MKWDGKPEDLVKALRYTKAQQTMHFNKYMTSIGVCFYLPSNKAGDYIRKRIMCSMCGYLAVTSWLKRRHNVTFANFWDFNTQADVHTYRLAWIDSMIQKAKEGTL